MNMKQSIATEFAPGSAMVQLADNGRLIERSEAIALGYTIAAGAAPAAPSLVAPPVDGPALQRRVWRAAIFNSPEAKSRDDATAEILMRHSPETLSVQDARAFLRGLPLEISEPPKAPTLTNTEDPRAARRAEIAASVASFNRDRGYATKASQPSLAAVDPTKLKRLAEIRLGALETAQANAAGGEAKKLRYALQVHDQTGVPLANVFTQLGIDTSKIVR
jgi:hypothetical protein